MNAGFDIIILLALVIFLINRLRNVLGENPDEENKNQQKQTPPPPPNADDIVKEFTKSIGIETIKSDENEEEKPNDEELSKSQEVFQKISEYKKINYGEKDFLEGAKIAFEMIVEAFANGDTQTLESLLDKRVYLSFANAIEDRKEKNQTVECQFIGFENAEIIDASLEEFEAQVTVKFVSEQINLLKDKDGNVIEGDEKFVETVTDIWTFAKDIRDNNPAWLLTSTKSV